jgi:hypothetical protein
MDVPSGVPGAPCLQSEAMRLITTFEAFATLEYLITASFKRRKMVNPKFWLTIGGLL